jgi:hypothetical protein
MTDTVALVIGGGNDPLAEYVAALKLCAAAGLPWKVFVCNTMIEDFPTAIDHGVTLHPDNLVGWLSRREAAGRARPAVLWAHRGYANVDQWTRDWLGSVGLFAVKIAREEQYRKIICCGVPMEPEGLHFKRQIPWVNAHGFRRSWLSHIRELAPFVRSMSGWTQEILGAPTLEWLRSDIPDPRPPSRSSRNYHMKA